MDCGGYLKRLLAGIAILLAVALATTGRSGFSVQETVTEATVQDAFAALPLVFEPNLGQAGEGVQYLVHQGRATTYFTPTETTIVMNGEHVRMSLAGASRAPTFTGLDKLPSTSNYLMGNDQSRWYTDIPHYQQLHIANVYQGIDLTYYGNDQQSLEHDFLVSPGADPTQIALQFTGQDTLSLDENGNLALRLGAADVTLMAPVSYQETAGGGRKAVESSYELHDDNTVTIALGAYDTASTLVIDPVLVYSTYLGGSSNEYGFAIDIDSVGYAYVGGMTDSGDFPTVNPYQGGIATDFDAFVTKFTTGGSNLVYSTYLGGDGVDQLLGIAVDSTGAAYLTGLTTSTDFPLQNEYQNSLAGGQDIFLAKLDASGGGLDYSTYFGGSGDEQPGIGIVIDGSGTATITGQTNSGDFPVSGFQSTYGGGTNDAILVQLFSDGTYGYSSYLGGSGNDIGYDIGIDSIGDTYVTGHTDSGDFPTVNAYQGSFAGGTNDAFLTRVYNDGSTIDFSTYYGGSGDDQGRSITLDSSDNSYLTGLTNSGDFPTVGAYQATNGGGYDAFVTSFDSSGSSPIYSTYLGGNGGDFGRGIDVDGSGNAFLTGDTASTNFPLASPAQVTLSGGSNDSFVTKLNAAGSALVYSTYLGGGNVDTATGITVDASGNAYVLGFTNSSDFPTVGPYQGSNAGGYDAFLAKISDTGNLFVQVATILTFAVNPTTCNLGTFSPSLTKFCTHTIAAATNASNGYVISYGPTTTLTSGANTITAMGSQTASVLASEQFGLNLRANTATGSFTSTDFGADAAGGSGSPMTGYELANQFKFNTSGDDIAQSTGATSTTTYTVSYIANITLVTETGLYATPITYSIVPSY